MENEFHSRELYSRVWTAVAELAIMFAIGFLLAYTF
jgi:hypothetical protein